MNNEATRQADECKRLVVRYGTTWMRCDRDALEYAIEKLASMIPAGGLAEEAWWQPIETDDDDVYRHTIARHLMNARRQLREQDSQAAGTRERAASKMDNHPKGKP